jgi:hypothetical protein
MSSPSASKLPSCDTNRFAYLLEQYCAERLMSRATQSLIPLFNLLLEVCSVDQPDISFKAYAVSIVNEKSRQERQLAALGKKRRT